MNEPEEDSTAADTRGGDSQHVQLSHYLQHLHEHTNQCQQRITGHDQSRVLPPSLYSPTSCWTGEEKGRFFHGLAIYSRLRPDLIAEHVATKSLADVQLYLSILEEGLNRFHATSSDNGLKFFPLPRNDFSIACEVSDDWIEYEDELANNASSVEPTLLRASIPRARDEEKRMQKLALRVKKGTLPARDREGEKVRNARYKDWLKRRGTEWEVEDALMELDDIRLRVLDSILRDDEDTWSVPRDSTLGGSKYGDDSLPKVEENGEKLWEGGEEDRDMDEDVDTNTTNGQLTEAAVAGLPSEDLSLSPASRKRLRKRLYMRRKRAEKTGQTADQSLSRLKPGRKVKSHQDELEQDHPENDFGNEEKPKRHAHVSGRTLPYKVREGLESLGIDAVRLRQDGLGLFHMTTISKLMRTYNKLHEVPEDVNSQISAGTIRALHDHTVSFASRLVRQSIVSRDQEMVAKTQTKVWRLANSQVITTGNVAHALSMLTERKYDRRQHFANLLERLDLEYNSEGSADEDEVNSIGRNNPDDEAQPSNDNSDGVQEQHIPSVTESLSLHRTIFPPFIRLPASGPSPSTSSAAPSSYLPWLSSSTGIAMNDGPEDLLESETDEEALKAELADEEQLDEQDHAEEEAYEKRLWNMFDPSSEDAELVIAGTKRDRPETDVSDSDEDRRACRRKRKKYKPRVDKRSGAAQGKIKSAPFIEDSDVEVE
ncbi:hypothetical protein BC629DRAFT_1459077 [Irpex lacteus]|nr:hypothetical protein BC629DRAFT_1459077 [Irpex lacteus]